MWCRISSNGGSDVEQVELLAEKAVRNRRMAARIVRSKIIRVVEGYDTAHRMRLRAKSRTEVFSRAYENIAWGSQESGSGTGSEHAPGERTAANLWPLAPTAPPGAGMMRLEDAPWPPKPRCAASQLGGIATATPQHVTVASRTDIHKPAREFPARPQPNGCALRPVRIRQI